MKSGGKKSSDITTNVTENFGYIIFKGDDEYRAKFCGERPPATVDGFGGPIPPYARAAGERGWPRRGRDDFRKISASALGFCGARRRAARLRQLGRAPPLGADRAQMFWTEGRQAALARASCTFIFGDSSSIARRIFEPSSRTSVLGRATGERTVIRKFRSKINNFSFSERLFFLNFRKFSSVVGDPLLHRRKKLS